jgi:hypothetical protein
MLKRFRIALAAGLIVLAGSSSAFADKGGKHHHGGLPPGLAKRESLPPGLAMQLRERGRLPPGLQKRLTRVPDGWGRPYLALRPHYVRYFAGRDLVVVDTRTQRIVSIVRGVR